MLDLKNYGTENNRGYRYVLVVFDNFSMFGWTNPLKNKNAQTVKDSFENSPMTSKKTNFKSIRWSLRLRNQSFQWLVQKTNNIKRYNSRYTSLAAVFAERFNPATRYLLKRPVFEGQDGNWIDVLPTITKEYKNRVHTSTKLTPIQAFFREDWNICLPKLIRQTEKNKD